MKIIENNSTPIKVQCIKCNSILEVNPGELRLEYVKLSREVFWVSFIEKCPCCKQPNSIVVLINKNEK